MKILTFDPSGNFGREGSGTTGLCFSLDDIPVKLDTLSAKDFENETEYWDAHVRLIERERPQHIVIEGYRLYNHKGQDAAAQTHSEMQTSQLIGVLKHYCYKNKISYSVQFASEVKTRWNEPILVRKGYLKQVGSSYYFGDLRTATHHRDALKHALHFWRYKRPGLQNIE